MNEQNPLPPDHPVNQIAQAVGGKVDFVSGPLPDGSGFATMSMPLPKDHWLTKEGFNVPPMPFRVGQGPRRRLWLLGHKREELRTKILEAARYAIRASTGNGREIDFDPDAMARNFVIGMLGYCTDDGLSSDEWANPERFRKKV